MIIVTTIATIKTEIPITIITFSLPFSTISTSLSEWLKEVVPTEEISSLEFFSAEDFSASRMDDSEIATKIEEIYKKYGEVIDPHTACGFADVSHKGTKIILSTASPAKFPELIEKVIAVHPTAESLEKLLSKPIVNEKMPANTQNIRDYISANGIK